MSESQPSSLEFRAGLLSHLGNMELGKRIRLKVSCKDYTDVSRKAMRKVITQGIRVCRVHQKHNKVQISGCIPHRMVDCG